ncbi:MAG: NAD-dependent epimerase/dehydratase family protein [Minisyncoccia bacterium]
MRKSKKETVLVTGGAGFIGSHVTDELLKLGKKVVVLDDLSGGYLDNIPKRAVFIKGSVTDKKLVNKIFKKYKFSYVYHLAAYAAEGLSHFIRKFNYENNLIGSVNLINASVNYGVKCFVFTSSIAVYGKNQLPMREDMVPAPEDPYGISKFAVELDLKAAHEMFGLNYIVFRPHNVYGERQNIWDKYRNVIGIFLRCALKGKPLTIFGDGKQTRAFTYIKDIAPLIAKSPLVSKAYNQVFNIGAHQPYSVKELAEHITAIIGSKKNILYLPPRKEVLHAHSDHRKLKKYFNYEPTYGLTEGLNAMIDWVKKTKPRKIKEFKNLDTSKNLPPIWR